ncbi:hypothetical protein [Lederbergia lenta]|uniref:hypothetical protein n=1 Tax=Lederbergia lenta TaxID=1467 RepID=UPI00203BA92C|nr:hypothetical protein [Lederbergia lenta]MCM3113456.1 hypothetical protein [Lederbergia lenta]
MYYDEDFVEGTSRRRPSRRRLVCECREVRADRDRDPNCCCRDVRGDRDDDRRDRDGFICFRF